MSRTVDEIFASPVEAQEVETAAAPAKGKRAKATTEGGEVRPDVPNFAVLMRTIADCGGTTSEKALLYAAMVWRDGRTGKVIASVPTLAQGASVVRRFAQTTLRRLEAAGAIRLVHRSRGGRGSVNVWSLDLANIAALEKPRSGERSIEGVDGEKGSRKRRSGERSKKGETALSEARNGAHMSARIQYPGGPLPADAVAAAPQRRPTAAERLLMVEAVGGAA